MELVSIIMPVYNGENYISLTIESVLNQLYENWELLITDDCSNDSTEKLIKSFVKKDSRVKYFKQDENGGSAKARNRSLKEAKGRFITFLDADDLWDNTFLEEQINFLREGNKAMVIGSYRRISETGEPSLKPFIVPEKLNYNGFLKNCCITCLTSVYDKEKMSIEFFDESLGSIRDDYAMWLKQLKKVDYVYGNTKVLASYRVFDSSVTANKWKLIIPHFNIYFKKEKLGFFKSFWYTMVWASKGILKYN